MVSCSHGLGTGLVRNGATSPLTAWRSDCKEIKEDGVTAYWRACESIGAFVYVWQNAIVRNWMTFCVEAFSRYGSCYGDWLCASCTMAKPFPRWRPLSGSRPKPSGRWDGVTRMPV